jgi:hypothetical protein
MYVEVAIFSERNGWLELYCYLVGQIVGRPQI